MKTEQKKEELIKDIKYNLECIKILEDCNKKDIEELRIKHAEYIQCPEQKLALIKEEREINNTHYKHVNIFIERDFELNNILKYLI